MIEKTCSSQNCHGECCWDFIADYFPINEERFLQAFPRAIKIDNCNEEELRQCVKPTETGVYYYLDLDENKIYFAVSGVCPNLDVDEDCSIHQKDYYPSPCKNLVPGSPKCKRKREVYIHNREFRKI